MYICQCNNCEAFVEDKNPHTHAVDFQGPLPIPVLKMDWDGEAWVCPNCDTDAYLKDISPDTILPNGYYRLYDNQTGGYLNSSYNALGLNEWAKEFAEYHLSDADDDLAEELLCKAPLDIIEIAYIAGFSLEASQTPFPENE